MPQKKNADSLELIRGKAGRVFGHVSFLQISGACPECCVALSLTPCLSALPGYESCPGHVRKLSVTWDYAGFFVGCTSFLTHLQLVRNELV